MKLTPCCTCGSVICTSPLQTTGNRFAREGNLSSFGFQQTTGFIVCSAEVVCQLRKGGESSEVEFGNMGDKYECTLDEKSLKKAKEELNEDPKERMSAVNSFRNWILEQPHLKCPTDTLFLLSFLRARKFSQLESRALLEKFLTMKTKHKEWFDDIDPLNPKIQTILSEGLLYSSPKRNEEGQVVIGVGFSGLQPWSGRYTTQDIFRAMMCVSYGTFFIDETLQVNGAVTFNDMTKMNMRMQAAFSLEEQKSFFGGWHRSIPARFKRMCLYNIGGFGDFIFAIMRVTMPEKLQSRVVNCGSNLENLYKQIPMECLPVEYLPDDYTGPNVGTTKELIEKFRANLSSPEIRERIRYLSSPQFGIDLAKRPKDAVAESFRKLSVE